jgi:hypothetical protein
MKKTKKGRAAGHETNSLVLYQTIYSEIKTLKFIDFFN